MSMYRFVKDNQPGASKRLFVQGTTSDGAGSKALGPPIVTSLSDPDNLQAVYTKKRLSTEVLGSSFESTKTSRCGEDGKRRITTKIVRKVTTLTRGEEQSRAEDLLKRAASKSIGYKEDVVKKTSAAKPKRVKVR
ncbi:hypothetical protein NQ317_019078 [Molorchus minor]|uniref:Uncharacterized protein n=1 Tax=Molorchus minor TaxID=1323400 RepID=A0ABQ9JMV4_9CUCU|nr:hypothetical protein NQ317_019078 [Molorchus minor]